MIHVKQTRTYEGPEYRGNCYQACVASIFELAIDMVPDLHGRGDSLLQHWLDVHYPGVAVRSRDVVPLDPRTEQFTLPVGQGWWIATVQSTRFVEPCNYHVVEGGEPMPPYWYHALECPHCGGNGDRPGFHAIVCRGNKVEHDPHPDCGGYDWSYVGKLVGVTSFEVSDPSRLSVRLTP